MTLFIIGHQMRNPIRLVEVNEVVGNLGKKKAIGGVVSEVRYFAVDNALQKDVWKALMKRS